MNTSPFLNRELPALRPGRAPAPALIARRGPGAEAIPLCKIGGVPCLIIERVDATATLVHLHGGGYRMGSAAAWHGFAERLCEHTGARIIVPDYALAPEQPYPAALHDAVAMLEDVVSQAPGPVILSGDSAGGGLALSVADLLAPPTPLAGLILMSPWLDLTLAAESYQRCAASDALFSRESAAQSAEDYLQGSSPTDPLASPLFAEATRLPPVLVFASCDEVLCDDALALSHRLTHARIRTILSIEPGLPHIWPVLLADAPASTRALSAIAAFVGEVSSPD